MRCSIFCSDQSSQDLLERFFDTKVVDVLLYMYPEEDK
jgi:hypothetical protein